jgi:arylsulfatase A-like enzyme
MIQEEIRNIRTKYFSASISLALLLSAACTPNQKEAAVASPPNILFILADDLGYHDLGVTGSTFYETPYIDSIARQSMAFTNGYATCQVCSPSRASILSGKFPARHGITDYIGAPADTAWRRQKRFTQLLPPDYLRQLPHAYTVLPEALREIGYRTFFAGKWHLGGEGSGPTDHGFDTNVGGWRLGFPRGGFFSPYDNPELTDGPVGENLSMRLAQETVDFLRTNNPQETQQPVFAFLSFYAVHSPIQTTQAQWRKYRDKAVAQGLAEQGYQMGHFLPIRQVQDNPVYAGLLNTMDEAIGTVLTTLHELGMDDNTVVVFTSDNGGVASGDAFSTANLPLRGGKGYQFEGGIREPFFIRVPGLTDGGKSSDVPVIGADFYPTLLALAGAELRPEEHQDGISLLPILRGEATEERPLFWHYPHYGNQGGEPSSIVRRGDWKLIHYYEDGREELYNLSRDPQEDQDVADQHPTRTHDLSTLLFDYLNQVEATYPRKDPQYRSDREQQYLQRVKDSLLPQLEERRLQLLSDDYTPGNRWWGSASVP